MHKTNLRGKVLFFPLGCIQIRPFKKVNFLTVKVPENLLTTSSIPIKKIYVKLLGSFRSKSRTSEPPGSSEGNEFHICVRVRGFEGRGKSLSGPFSFVFEKYDWEESSPKSLGGMTRPKDEMGSQIVSFESDVSHPILVYLSRNNNSSQAQARRSPALALTAPEPEFPVNFGSKWDPLTSAWRRGGASSERQAELPTGVSPLQKRIWKRYFYHCSSCNFFFHIGFCHLWCELPL